MTEREKKEGDGKKNVSQYHSDCLIDDCVGSHLDYAGFVILVSGHMARAQVLGLICSFSSRLLCHQGK